MGTGDVQNWNFFGVTQIKKYKRGTRHRSVIAKKEPVMKMKAYENNEIKRGDGVRYG